MSNSVTYPRLAEAIRIIAYDNGCVNRFNPESEVVSRAYDRVVAHYESIQLASDLANVDSELAKLTDDELLDVCTMPEEERAAISSIAEEILDVAFDYL